jgi:hypothetical protein
VTGSPSKAPGPGLSTSASVKVRTMTSKLITSRGPQYPRAPVDIKTQVPSVTWLSLHRTHAGPLMQGQSYLHSRYTVSFRDNDKKKKISTCSGQRQKFSSNQGALVWILFLLSCFEIGSYRAQLGLELLILLPQPPVLG